MKPPKSALYILYGALFAAAALLLWRYVLPCLLPFIIALGLAALMEPAVAFLSGRGRLPRPLASGLCTLLLTGALFAALVWGLGRVLDELTSLTGRLPEILDRLLAGLSALKAWARGCIDRAPAAVGEYLGEALDSLSAQLSAVPARLSEKLPALISATAGGTPDVLLFSATVGLGAYFASASFPELKRFLLRQLPEKLQSGAQALKEGLCRTLLRWLEAQFLLMAATFCALSVAFSVLGLDYALLIALATALVDALPILGTGTVLIPWAACCFITGRAPLGAGLLITYAAVTLLRNCLQAKLVGDRLGLHPLVSLLAVYVGYRVCGFLGMLLFPLLAAALCRLNERGIIRLWKL